MPPFARSKKPMCWRSAPVKLPFSWPNNSLSISFGEIGAAVDGEEVLAAPPAQVVDGLGDDSLPVPLSPVISTAAPVRDTRDIRS